MAKKTTRKLKKKKSGLQSIFTKFVGKPSSYVGALSAYASTKNFDSVVVKRILGVPSTFSDKTALAYCYQANQYLRSMSNPSNYEQKFVKKKYNVVLTNNTITNQNLLANYQKLKKQQIAKQKHPIRTVSGHSRVITKNERALTPNGFDFYDYTILEKKNPRYCVFKKNISQKDEKQLVKQLSNQKVPSNVVKARIFLRVEMSSKTGKTVESVFSSRVIPITDLPKEYAKFRKAYAIGAILDMSTKAKFFYANKGNSKYTVNQTVNVWISNISEVYINYYYN